MSLYISPIPAHHQHIILSSARIAVTCFINDCLVGFKFFFSKAEIDDIVGDTILKACVSYSSYDPAKAKLTTLLGTIAKHCVLTAIVNKNKRKNISYSYYSDNYRDGDKYSVEDYYYKHRGFIPEIRDRQSEYDVEKELSCKEFKQRIDSVCSEFSERDRRYKDWILLEYAPREMAEMDGCTPNAAAKRACGIRQVLRDSLPDIAAEFGIYEVKRAS